MAIHFCKKHGFVPMGEQLEHCLSQNCRIGCKNLGLIPTEHPKYRRESQKNKRRKTKEVLYMLKNASQNGNGSQNENGQTKNRRRERRI